MESIIAKVMELQNKENTNIPLYEKQLRDAESGIQNMLNAIQAGILTSSTKERLEQLEETKRELEARIAEEKLAKPKVTEEFIRFWLRRFRKLDMSLKDQRQALVDTFINAIQAGILTSSTKERLEQLEETKRELEARIAEEKLAKPKVTEEFIRFWLLRFRKLDMSLKDQRQALVDTFINSIYLYDDKVLIAFNYKEGTQTVTFEEAAQAASKGNGSDLDCFTAP